MPGPVRQNRTNRPRLPKFATGAVVGAVIGTLALFGGFNLAIYLLTGLIIVAAYLFFLTNQRSVSKTWTPQKFAPAPAFGALIVGVMSVFGLQYLGTSSAWHPQGTIKKTVQNITTGSAVSDANNSIDAIPARPGDIIQYNITISNVAPPASKQWNDLAFVKMTDKLPDGVELISNPAQRQITEDLGTILPGKSVTKQYQLKVTATKKDSIIINKACFTGDSVVKDNPQSGCDPGLITIVPPVSTPNPTPPTTTPPTPPTPPSNPPTPPSNPPTPPSNPPTPTPPTTTPPATPPTPPATPPTTTPPVTPTSAPTQLPNVGPTNILVVALFAAVTGYIFSALYTLRNRSSARRY